jgi:hypothetical protein
MMGNALRVGLLALGLIACGDSSEEAADCSSASLSYEATAAALGEKYCISCHDSSLAEGSDRGGSPLDVNFDSEAGWLEHGAHALDEIRAGRMPPTGEKPSEAEVERVEQWLSCEGASEHDHDDDHTH